jgi:CheY-like chemotaxis protein
MADPTQVHQVIMNLCTNAAHAMRDKGGELTVALDMISVDEKEASGGQRFTESQKLRLAVSDTGVGIPAESLDRVFDPFYTTKKPSEGTGMGLAVVHGIVTECGGTIQVHSSPGIGTTFEIRLPIIDQEPETDIAAASPLPLGNERILLVDDEPSIIDICVQMLEPLGYQVTALLDSREALALFSRAPQDFDLVITDMTMPYMTGDQLGRKMLAIRENIPIIICTGYSSKLTNVNIRSLGFADIAHKPFIIRDLAKTIRKTLDRHQSYRP